MLKPLCIFLLGTASVATAVPQSQVVFGSTHEAPSSHASPHSQDAIAAVLEKYSDPVEAMVHLDPASEALLSEPRLLRVSGEAEARWLTEGDKLRLRKERKKFVDITEHEDFYADQVDTLSGHARKFPSQSVQADL